MSRRIEKSQASFERASGVLAGGVNSPVRAYAAVGGTPLVIARAKGAHVTDIDGNTYVDYVGGYGPAILGHAPEQVVTSINKAARNGTSYGAPTELETHLGEAIVSAVASVEKVRFTNSGTEAVMTAVRLARGATGRDKLVKCVGCYHGHADALLVAAGSGAATLGAPSSAGVTQGAVADTLLVPYNDLAAIGQVFDKYGSEIAAVLIEPVAGNMGVVAPQAGYLPGLREICDNCGALLIFDEVMTGFRLAYGGAQELCGVRADITTLGKVIGGGLPVGAVGASAELMKHLAPEGPVYQAGTLSGNPVVMAAGLATLQALRQEGFYEQLEARSAELTVVLEAAARQEGLTGKICINRVGSMLCCFFAPAPVGDYAAAAATNRRAFAAFFHAMLAGGVCLPPSQFEAMFVSAAHRDSDIEKTAAAAATAFAAAAKLMKKNITCR